MNNDVMSKTLLVAVAACSLSGCATDAWTNKEATGFNAFLNQIADVCAPLEVGPMVVTRNYEPPNYAAGQYDNWLDQTSRLYYQRITAEKYVQNISNLGPFPGTIRAAKCVAAQATAAVPPPPSMAPPSTK